MLLIIIPQGQWYFCDPYKGGGAQSMLQKVATTENGDGSSLLLTISLHPSYKAVGVSAATVTEECHIVFQLPFTCFIHFLCMALIIPLVNSYSLVH